MGTTSLVGGLSLPLAATGVTNTALTDPVVELLLAFVGHILTADINPRLTDLPATPVASCPAANRYGYAPAEPRGEYITMPAPSLWIWWAGQSTTNRMGPLLKFRRRELSLLYVFPELPQRAAMEARRGMQNAIDASLTRWLAHGWHPTFTYNGKAAGHSIEGYITSQPSTLGIMYLGGRGMGRYGIDDPDDGETGGQKAGRDHPTYAGLFAVEERIDPLDPEFHAQDHPVAISHDGAAVLERVADGADGAEPEDGGAE